MKHGNILIMHSSSSSEHFRTGGKGGGAQLQTGAGKGKFPICLQASLQLDNSSQEYQLLLSITISPELLLGSCPWGHLPLSKLIFKVLSQPSRLIK